MERAARRVRPGRAVGGMKGPRGPSSSGEKGRAGSCGEKGRARYVLRRETKRRGGLVACLVVCCVKHGRFLGL